VASGRSQPVTRHSPPIAGASGVRSCADRSPLATACHRQAKCQRPNGARSRRPSSHHAPNQAISADKFIRFSPAPCGSPIDYSLVPGGAQRQWLQAYLLVGHHAMPVRSSSVTARTIPAAQISNEPRCRRGRTRAERVSEAVKSVFLVFLEGVTVDVAPPRYDGRSLGSVRGWPQWRRVLFRLDATEKLTSPPYGRGPTLLELGRCHRILSLSRASKLVFKGGNALLGRSQAASRGTRAETYGTRRGTTRDHSCSCHDLAVSADREPLATGFFESRVR
jgi:hypothetical protein